MHLLVKLLPMIHSRLVVKCFFLDNWRVQRSSKVALKKKAALFGHSSVQLRYARGSRAPRVCARTPTHPRTGMPAGTVRKLAGLAARRSLCAQAGPAVHPADSNISACAVEMSTVGKSQDTAWKDVLDTKGLSADAPILEEYGLSCESDMSIVDEEDLVVLCSKLKQFQSKLLRKWVQGLGDEQRVAAFMKEASTAKKHSTSPLWRTLEKRTRTTPSLTRRRTGTRTQTQMLTRIQMRKTKRPTVVQWTSKVRECPLRKGTRRQIQLYSEFKQFQASSLQHVQYHFWRGSRSVFGFPRPSRI